MTCPICFNLLVTKKWVVFVKNKSKMILEVYGLTHFGSIIWKIYVIKVKSQVIWFIWLKL
jgi:hypothetical protein